MISGKKLYVRLLGDIRFWILLFFAIRLFGITNPPLEGAHNWRQCLTDMVARNFVESGADFLHPKIDMAGEKTGIIGTEFPALNYLIYLFSLIFGYNHWFGRLINLIVSSFAIYAFYRSLRIFQNKQIAFYASMVLLGSIWFSFSRKIMPDTFSASLVLLGLYFGLQAFAKGRFVNFLLFIIFSALGVLSKLPSIVLLSVLVIPLFNDRYRSRDKMMMLLSGIITLAPVYYWYLVWVPHLNETYGYQLYFPKTITEAISQLLENPSKALSRIYFDSLFSYLGFAAAMIGLLLAFIRKEKVIRIGFVLIFSLFVVFVLKAGSSFIVNNYYVIPLVPALAWLAGYFVSTLHNTSFRTILIAIIVLEGVVNQQHDFFIKKKFENRMQFEKVADKVSTKKDLILINGGQNPRDIYFLNRKGWSLENQEITDRKLNELRNNNCQYIFILKENNIELSATDFVPIYSDEIFDVYASKSLIFK